MKRLGGGLKRESACTTQPPAGTAKAVPTVLVPALVLPPKSLNRRVKSATFAESTAPSASFGVVTAPSASFGVVTAPSASFGLAIPPSAIDRLPYLPASA